MPRYDAATEANFAVAERLLSGSGLALLAANATRENLLDALEALEAPLFAMTHGRPDQLLAQGGGRALDLQDVPLLAGRTTFAYACHTAQELGEAVAAVHGHWWGYTGSIGAPDLSSELLPLFIRIFSSLREAFPSAQSAREKSEVLSRIADLCREAEERVTDLWMDNADLDIGSALFCLMHIWQRLRVWGPGASVPLKHPEAPPPLLLL